MKKELYGMGGPPCPEKCVPQHVAAQLRRTDNLIFRKMNEIGRAAGVEDITFMHGWILRHLYLHQDQEVCQRDIERDFSITRSTTTNILQLILKCLLRQSQLVVEPPFHYSVFLKNHFLRIAKISNHPRKTIYQELRLTK